MGLSYARFNFRLKAIEPIQIQRFSGTTLRGAFGIILKRTVCIHSHLRECQDCLVRRSCIYSYLFETSLKYEQKEADIHGEDVPHPFVQEPPEVSGIKIFHPDDIIDFGLVLMGRGIEYLPHIVYAFEKLGEKGLGRGRGRFVLDGVALTFPETKELYQRSEGTLNLEFMPAAFNPTEDTASVSKITLNFITPLRIKHHGKFIDQLDFYILIVSLLRRINTLAVLHGDGELSIDWNSLLEIARQIETVSDNTHWIDYQRYSGRQKQTMQLGGLVGTMSFRGNLSPFIAYLRAGEILHVGKSTSFGFGKYEMKI